MLITRGLQEWACLLPQQLPFASAARLLGWHAHEESAVLATTTLRNLVREHGQIVRKAEVAEAEMLIARFKQADSEAPTPRLVLPTRTPHRRPGWPAELSASVEEALIASSSAPPKGVSHADWERVLCARREEANSSVPALRLLGPQVTEDEVVVGVDEVLTRRPEKHRFNELRTARVLTARGGRYLSGTGASFLLVLTAYVLLCAGTNRSVLVLADGARWIRNWFFEISSNLRSCQLLLDWYHLRKKCHELGSMICRGRKAKAQLLRPVLRALWTGQFPTALSLLDAYRSEAKNVEKLDELLQYLRDRQPFLPHYAERRRMREYIGSGHVEKANDLIVAQRQKGLGMHWSEDTSDGLAALKTLMLNGGWDLYWTQRNVLPLAA
jgi:hypothetical protein